MAIDRRVQRTRTALYDALVSLIREKDYDAISVADILAVANVGRSTFYAHFTSKDDLLAKSLDRLKALLAEAVAAAQADHADAAALSRVVTRALFAHVYGYRDVPLALGEGRGNAVLMGATAKALTSVARDLPLQAPPGIPRELAVEFVVATFMTVLGWWFGRRPEMKPEEAEALYLRLIGEGLGFGPAAKLSAVKSRS